MVNISQAFDTENRSVFEHFQRPGVGFYIPLYQREYSWDKDNIEQLLEDISTGVSGMIQNPNDEIRFLGTLITVNDSNRINVQPKDPKAVPSVVEVIIDGQQRLSTISFVAMVLAQHIKDVEKKVNKAIKRFVPLQSEQDDLIKEVREICDWWESRLHDVFSLDLKRGTPSRKPKVIRGSIDKWVMQDDGVSYTSSVTKYVSEYISAFFEDKEFPKITKDTTAGRNLKMIDDWVRYTIVKAHIDEDRSFCDGFAILSNNSDQVHIWQYQRDNITTRLNNNDVKDGKSFTYSMLSLIQLFAACHYLLDRCCFTVIQPISDKWAFDMFQSLNATGTPLTAIETFKPLVINDLKIRGVEFKNSEEDIYFSKIEASFNNLNKAADKNKFTNDLITSFAIPVDAYRCPTHFSAQRAWLDTIYNTTLTVPADKRLFLKFFGCYAEFYKEYWLNYKGIDNETLDFLSGHKEADLASLLFLYLKDSGHRMSVTLLGTFYNYLKDDQCTKDDYVELLKSVAAFYTLWRSSNSNSGLDEIYRSFFKENDKQNSWLLNKRLKVEDVKKHLSQKLLDKNINTKSTWSLLAKDELRYDKPVICKFALYATSHQTIADSANIGLMKEGSIGVNPFLTLEKWSSPDLCTIEHIAPQSQNNGWTDELYADRKTINMLGNLTLLPVGLNSSAGNKSWREKLLYYKHVGNEDPGELANLAHDANQFNVSLDNTTLERLKSARFSSHIKPILTVDYSDNWDLNLVNSRTERMASVLWDKISSWVV